MSKLRFLIVVLFLSFLSGSIFAQTTGEDDGDISKSEETKHSRRGEKVERDIAIKNTFVPKGQWVVGSSISFSVSESDNYKFVVIEKFDARLHNVKVSPIFGYAFKDNQVVGVRGTYKRNFSDTDTIRFALDDDFDGTATDYYNLKHTYSAAITYRYYISMGKSQRFGIFNEVQFEVGGGRKKVVDGRGNDLVGTFEKTKEFKLSIVPGLSAFINDFTSAELSIGVLGFGYSKTKQIENRVYEGSYHTGHGNFKIDIFSISLGLAFYL